MTAKARKIESTSITKIMKKAYMDYAMSVIVSRALPDVKDGLKPVQRRILYAFHQIGETKYIKSAKIIGEVLGKYHPHGDSSVYGALVRMAQEFSMRYCTVDGQGNFGSIDGDPPAAMRYTEAKMSKISKEMLHNINKETVDFVDNFDGTLKEPMVLPARIPHLLLNGADGIAVGMATKIPPHNLTEVFDALIYMIKNSELETLETAKELEFKKLETEKEKTAENVILREVNELKKYQFELETTVSSKKLLKYIKGPDFPTGGIIYNHESVSQVYTTGKGRIPIRGRAEIKEGKRGKHKIIISELPYQVNKANLVTKIAGLVRDKKIKGISDLRDESDRKGIRVVVELKRTGRPRAVLNKLYKYTDLQKNYPANIVALVDGVPQSLTLRQMLLLYLRHRHDVIRKQSLYDFKKAKFRAHILEGLKIALDNLDEVIETIKKSKDTPTAKKNLIKKFDLTDLQAQAILDMQLKRLAALERKKIEEEYKEIQKLLDQLIALVTKPKKMLTYIEKELKKIKEKYGDKRKTKVYKHKLGDFNEEDLIPKRDGIVTITKTGYIKQVAKGTYRSQRRGGKGVSGMSTKEEDTIQQLISCSSHDELLFFTNKGKVYQKRVWEIPETKRQAKGQAVINLIDIEQNEDVEIVLKKSAEKNDEKYIFMATKKGKVKRTNINRFKNIRTSGIIAINIKKGDDLVQAQMTNGKRQIMLVTKKGKSIRFNEKDVRQMGRTAQGVKGINLKTDDEVIAMASLPEKLPEPEDKRCKVFRHLLVITEKGLGKRTDVYKYPLQKRGGVGVKVANLTQKTGDVACAKVVDENTTKVVLTSKKARIIKLPLKNIPELGRTTQGVIIMRFKAKTDKIAAMTCLQKHKEKIQKK